MADKPKPVRAWGMITRYGGELLPWAYHNKPDARCRANTMAADVVRVEIRVVGKRRGK